MVKRTRLMTGAFGALLGAALLAGCVPPPEDPPVPVEPGTLHELLDPSGSAPGLSRDGHYITQADNEGVEMHDRVGSTVVRLSGETVHTSAVSDDGRYVAYRHNAVELGSNGPTLSVWDTLTDSVAPAPSLGARGGGSMSVPSISADGRYVAYTTGNPCNWFCIDRDIYANAYLFDRVTGQTTQLTDFGLIVEYDPDTTDPNNPWFVGTGIVDAVHVTGDGTAVIYSRTISDADQPGFEHAAHAVLSWDRATGVTTQIAAPAGEVTGITASHDGSRIAFQVTEYEHTAGGGIDADFSVEVLSDTPLDLSGTPVGADELQGYPELSADGSMLFFATGEMVMWLSPTLEPTELVAVELDGAFSARREIADVEDYASVRPVRAIELGGAHAVAYRIFGSDAGYSLHAWQPR